MKLDLKTLGLLAVVGVLCLFVYDEYMVEKPFEVWPISREKPAGSSAIVEIFAVKNNLLVPQTVQVEAGIIPEAVSNEWFGYGFSFMFKQNPNDCCAGQVNIQGSTITLLPGETRQIVFALGKPYYGIQDKCGSTNYFAANGRYKVYALVSNHCNWLNGVQQAGYVNFDKYVSDY